MTGRRPYKQVARSQARERTREALLQAAADELYEGDWSSSSLESISSKAGVTKQTLLRHFGSKTGLLLATMLQGYTQVHDQRWSAPQSDVAGAVENLLDHYEAWGKRSLRIGAWLDQGHPLLAKVSQLARETHYRWVDHAFGAWLENLDTETRSRRRASLITLCDVHTWWLLSHDLRLARAEIQASLTDAIEGILEVRK